LGRGRGVHRVRLRRCHDHAWTAQGAVCGQNRHRRSRTRGGTFLAYRMTDRLTSLLAERPWLLADGATGSNLFERGLQSGDAPELWNSDHPQRVAELQRAFVDVGADIILTNSFGGTRHRLKLHKADARVAELNEKAALISRKEADRAG